MTEVSRVYIFNTHIEAEDAIHALDKSGYDIKKLSVIGKGYHTEEHPVGFYTAGDQIKSWGGIGAFWGGLWGMLLAPAVFFLPGIGLIALAGPVVSMLVGALEGAVQGDLARFGLERRAEVLVLKDAQGRGLDEGLELGLVGHEVEQVRGPGAQVLLDDLVGDGDFVAHVLSPP